MLACGVQAQTLTMYLYDQAPDVEILDRLLKIDPFSLHDPNMGLKVSLGKSLYISLLFFVWYHLNKGFSWGPPFIWGEKPIFKIYGDEDKEWKHLRERERERERESEREVIAHRWLGILSVISVSLQGALLQLFAQFEVHMVPFNNKVGGVSFMPFLRPTHTTIIVNKRRIKENEKIHMSRSLNDGPLAQPRILDRK